jgi:hypothetical protein
MPSRSTVIQALLDLFNEPRYLEIGVYRGATFRAVEATTKVAVDPEFAFALPAPAPGTAFHEVTSEFYFGQLLQRGEKFDVIFLDGLHTFEQTLRDLTNSLLCLSDGGVVVIDDVCPVSSLAAVSSYSRFNRLRELLHVEDGSWMGDVYRLVFFIEAFFQQLSYRTIAEDYGQMVVWHQPRLSLPERSVADVADMTYEDMILARSHFNARPWDELLAEVRISLKAIGS